MAREETLYKLSEACLATGLKRSTNTETQESEERKK